MQTRRGLAATLAVLTLFPAAAEAQRFYIGASGGTTRVQTDYASQVTSEIASPFSANDFEAFDVKVDSSGTPGRLFAGFRLSEVFAIEADYTRLGNIRSGFKFKPTANPDGYTQHDVDHEPEAISIAMLAHVRLPHDLSLFGRAGVARTRLRQAGTSCVYVNDLQDIPRLGYCGSVFSAEVRETRPVAGLGVDWRFAERFALRASWDRYFGVGKPFAIQGALDKETFGEFDIDYFALGVTYSF